MVVILCFLLAFRAGQLACRTFCILVSIEVSLVSPGLGCWPLSLILNSHLIMASSSYSHCKTFFRLLNLSLVCTLLRLLGNSRPLHSHISGVVRVLWGSSQAYPSRHPLQPLLYQVWCWMEDFSIQLLGYALHSQAMILLFWISSHLSQISISLSRDASFPSVILPNWICLRRWSIDLLSRSSQYLNSTKSPSVLPFLPAGWLSFPYSKAMAQTPY